MHFTGKEDAKYAAAYTMDEAAERLHKSRRWLQDWLRDNPADSLGKPFFAQLGRTKVFTDESLSRILAACMEDQRCRSSSSRRVRVGARTGGFAGRTSDATLTEALALAKRHSPRSFAESSSATSKVVRLPDRKEPASRERQRPT
jgi:hypothetical protein